MEGSNNSAFTSAARWRSRSRTSPRGRPSGDKRRAGAPREAGAACEKTMLHWTWEVGWILVDSGGFGISRALEREHCLIKVPGLSSLVEQGTQLGRTLFGTTEVQDFHPLLQPILGLISS